MASIFSDFGKRFFESGLKHKGIQIMNCQLYRSHELKKKKVYV